MSNHFTGLSLGPPLGDQRLDLCDLYAFQSPADKNRTVIILNANPNADALHPDAIYRLNIDNDGDYLTDIAFSYVFSKRQNGRQTVSVFAATGSSSTSTESRTCSISGVNGTSPSLISAASLHGPGWIRIRKRTCFRLLSSCPRVNSLLSPRCTSGGGAV